MNKEIFSERNEFGIYIESRSDAKGWGYVVWDDECIVWEGTVFRVALSVAKKLRKEKITKGNYR